MEGIDSLTPRELQIAILLSYGVGTKDIARELNISTRTVESHKYSIFQRLGIDNIAVLARLLVDWEHLHPALRFPTRD